MLFALLGACDQPAAPEAGGASSEARVFEVRGVVQEVRENGAVLVIDHEKMPGYMDAMIMPFRVKDPSEASGLNPGDVVEFRYVVEELSSWIENIRATGETGAVKTRENASAEPAAPQLDIGDVLPDYEFIDEEGREVKLSDFRGGPVALTFIFTRCPVPEYCPAMMRNFASVRETLETDPDAPANWRLLTISFDSLHDTPEVMKSYGAAFGQDGRNWSMLSSLCCSIDELAANVGLKFGEVEGSYQHNLRTLVLDAEGRIERIFTDETWSPQALVAAIKAAAPGVADS